MGTVFEAVLIDSDRAKSAEVLHFAREEISRLENKLSRFRPDSEVTRINRLAATKPVLVDFEMLEILTTALDYYRRTAGAFDVTVAPMLRKWKAEIEDARVERARDFRELAEQVGSDKVIIDRRQRTVCFARAGVEIDLGSLGKGFALRGVLQAAKDVQVESGFLSFGGSSICAWGEQYPGAGEWVFGCEPSPDPQVPAIEVSLRNSCFSMSGNFRPGDKGTVATPHIFDPRTGQPPVEVESAAVEHPCPFTAELLSTAMLVLGPEESRSAELDRGARGFFSLVVDREHRVVRFGE